MERPVKRIVLKDLPADVQARGPAKERQPQARPGADPARARWLVPPLMLAAIAVGLLLLLRGPKVLLGIALVAILGLALLWVLISALFPAKADRRCPSCGENALRRLDPHSTSGIRCASCGMTDESASAWLLAEEEGPLERTVLRERAQRRGSALRPAPESPPPGRASR